MQGEVDAYLYLNRISIVYFKLYKSNCLCIRLYAQCLVFKEETHEFRKVVKRSYTESENTVRVEMAETYAILFYQIAQVLLVWPIFHAVLILHKVMKWLILTPYVYC